MAIYFTTNDVECIMHNERAGWGFRQKDKKTDFCWGSSLKLDAWDKNYGF